MSLWRYWKLSESRRQDRWKRNEGLIHNPTYRRYCRTHRLDPHDREAQMAFMGSPRGWQLTLHLGLGLDKPAVEEIPNQKRSIVITQDGRSEIGSSSVLRDGCFLTLCFDLANPKNHLLSGLSFQLALFLRYVDDRPQRISPLSSGTVILSCTRPNKAIFLKGGP